MNPTFVVASKNLESDVSALKKILGELVAKAGNNSAYKLAEKGQLAAGWWFYEIYLNPQIITKILEIEFVDKKKTERDLLEMMQANLKQKGSSARIRLYKDKPFLAKWWAWLLK